MGYLKYTPFVITLFDIKYRSRRYEIDQVKNRNGNSESFVAAGTCVTTGSVCLSEHLLSRYPIPLFHFGLLLIISSVVCQGQRFAFSPGPLKN